MNRMIPYVPPEETKPKHTPGPCRINVYLAGHESDLTAWLGRYGADVDCRVISATRGTGDVRDVVVLDVASADADFVCEALQNDGSVVTYCVEAAP